MKPATPVTGARVTPAQIAHKDVGEGILVLRAWAVDSSGILPDGKGFSTPAEMRTILNERIDEFSRTLTEKMLVYALGRGLERYDRPTVRQITTRLEGSGYGLQTLVREVVNSLPFQSRRAEAPRVVAAK